jgi:hypothetical protein
VTQAQTLSAWPCMARGWLSLRHAAAAMAVASRHMATPGAVILVVAAAAAASVFGGASARVVGFHLDNEHCTTDTRFGNRSTLVPPCLAVLGEYAHWVGNLSGSGLVLSVDTGACAAATCINISWGGVSKPAHEHVIDIVNETVVMDYTDSASGAVSYDGRGAARLLSYASTFTPPRPVRLGLAVRQPGAPRTWWQAGERCSNWTPFAAQHAHKL